ncbi:hypothetical protein KSB_92750 [Ktedonobacter robiniae]|uniref:Uncharacterized protein n=1 Tax=Ktedonobacter robiniae TaxID=2778365 RepID=A0ABQ3V843_9CHLR|nr:hypothetical protein KSB_92750 [Ktedonobacter robiniae]
MFQRQLKADHCYLYVQGHVVIQTDQVCEIRGWASVVGPDTERDLLILGDMEDVFGANWNRVRPTTSARLLLSTHPLGEEGEHLQRRC